MVEHGELDSNEWNMIEPFYEQPLSVPYGELSILRYLYPETPEELPVTENALSVYLPWDTKQIGKFFNDWPDLVRFKPILDFSITVPSGIGRIGFSLNSTIRENEPAQYAQFTVEPFSGAKIQGRLHITDQYARWNSRKLEVSLFNKVKVMAGDVAPSGKMGLVAGYFPKGKKADSSLVSNWIYGDARGWNSITMQYTFDNTNNKLCFQPFFHKRQTETAIGISGTLDIHNVVDNTLSALVMELPEQHGTVAYIVYGVCLNTGPLTLELETSVMLNNIPFIPLILKGKYRTESDALSVKLLFIPTGYKGTRSAELYSVGGTSMTNKEVSVDVLSTEWKFRHILLETVTISPAASMVFYDYRLSSLLSGSTVEIQTRPGHYRASYYWHTSSKTSLSHSFSCAFIMDCFKQIEPGFEIESKYYKEQQFELFGNVSIGVVLKEGLKINPSFLYSKYYTSEETFTIGLSQILTLFKSTYSDIRIENVFGKSETEWGNFRVKAKMWFLF